MDKEERRKLRKQMVDRRLANQGDWLAWSIDMAKRDYEKEDLEGRRDKKEAGRELMQMFCERQEIGPIEPQLLAYFADCFREILNGKDVRDALNIRNPDGRGRPSNWAEQFEWAIKVQRRKNFGQSRNKAIQAVANEIHKEPRTVELAYDEYRVGAEKVAEKPHPK